MCWLVFIYINNLGGILLYYYIDFYVYKWFGVSKVESMDDRVMDGLKILICVFKFI